MSPGENVGVMLPDSTVTGRYKPVRGSRPRPRSPTQAIARATRESRSGDRRSAALTALLPVLEIPAGIAARYLLVAARWVPVNA
jgi:hypothetical protein